MLLCCAVPSENSIRPFFWDENVSLREFDMNVYHVLKKYLQYFNLFGSVLLAFLIPWFFLSVLVRYVSPELNNIGISNDLLGVFVLSIAAIFASIQFFLVIKKIRKVNQ